MLGNYNSYHFEGTVSFGTTRNWHRAGGNVFPAACAKTKNFDVSIDYAFDSFDVKAIVAHRGISLGYSYTYERNTVSAADNASNA